MVSGASPSPRRAARGDEGGLECGGAAEEAGGARAKAEEISLMARWRAARPLVTWEAQIAARRWLSSPEEEEEEVEAEEEEEVEGEGGASGRYRRAVTVTFPGSVDFEEEEAAEEGRVRREEEAESEETREGGEEGEEGEREGGGEEEAMPCMACSTLTRKCCCAPMTDPGRAIRSQPMVSLARQP